jgi:hypothetical protein
VSIRDETRARLASPGRWGEEGNAAAGPRHVAEAPDRRRRCSCGCKGRTTHVGYANGCAMTSGCELYVRRWVRDPREAARVEREQSGVAPKGCVIAAARLGAAVHITDVERPEYPKPRGVKGRKVVPQYKPGTVLGYTLCDLPMLVEDAWVGYRGDPVADGSLCGGCGERAGVALDQAAS